MAQHLLQHGISAIKLPESHLPKWPCPMVEQMWAHNPTLHFLSKQHRGAGPGGRDVGKLPGESECGRADPSTCLLWDGTEVMPTFSPLPPPAVRKSDHRFMNSRELALHLVSCNTWESRSCTSLGSIIELNLKEVVQRSCPGVIAWKN